MLKKLHRVRTQTGGGKIITKRGETLGRVKDPMGNFPGQINNRTIKIKEKKLTPRPGPIQRTKKREKLSLTKKTDKKTEWSWTKQGETQYQNQYLRWRPGRILYTPAKPTTEGDRKAGENQQQKHSVQKEQHAEEQQAWKKTKTPARRRRNKARNPLHMKHRNFTSKINHIMSSH